MKNIMTIDLEEWFHANYHDKVFDNSREYQVRVVDSTMKLLENFSKYNAKATFFVLGYIAEKHPDLIKEIHAKGHEIATHGYSHELVYNQSKEQFELDVKKAIDIIEKVINSKVKGYRAPSWSVTEKSLWAWEILEKLGLKYDASVFPIKNYLYGLPSSERVAYNPIYDGEKLNILEVPMSTVKVFNHNIPFSGGFYFRALPYQAIKYGIKKVNSENSPAIIYLHPREIDLKQPKLDLNFKDSLIHYTGIKGCEVKLLKVLKHFEFASIEDFYNIK